MRLNGIVSNLVIECIIAKLLLTCNHWSHLLSSLLLPLGGGSGANSTLAVFLQFHSSGMMERDGRMDTTVMSHIGNLYNLLKQFYLDILHFVIFFVPKNRDNVSIKKIESAEESFRLTHIFILFYVI